MNILLINYYMVRKIILNLAISLDGFIADNKGSFTWIKGNGDNNQDTKKQFDFTKFSKSVDTIVMGRKAYNDSYEISKKMLESKKVLVATYKELKNKEDNIEIISGDIVSKITKLKKEKGKNIWLFGGGVVIDPFIKANVIDEYIIGVIPIILGSGRPLFLENNPLIKLHLNESTSQEGIVILKYTKRKIKKNSPTRI
jgi:dihydrofolate reductase